MRKNIVFQGLERVRAPKSEPLGPESRAKGGQDGQKVPWVRTVIWRSLGRLCSESCYLLKCMKNISKTIVFEGSERAQAPKSEPLGPKSRAQEGLWGPKIAPKGVRTARSRLGQSRRRGQESHLEVFWATLWQKSLFLEMYEKPKEKHGFSRVREGPGAQVGATWPQSRARERSGQPK